MSETNKRDYNWIGMLLILLLIGWKIVEVLPFNIYINILIAILAVVLIVVLFIVGAIGLVYFFAYALGARGQAIQDSWDYWEKMKVYKWNDLTEEEQSEHVSACRVIESDCGGVPDYEKILTALKEQLPITDPHVGLKYSSSYDAHKLSPWDYYYSLRHKSWNELSEYEKERMIFAVHLILDECGTLSNLSETEAFLKIHLPETPNPYPGGDRVLGGFIERQKNMKTLE